MPHTIFQHRQRETEALLHSFDWTWESYLWYFNRKEGECWKVILSGNKWGRFHGNTLIPSSQCEKDSRSTASRRLGYLFPCSWVGWHFYHTTFTSTLFVPVHFLCEGFWGGSVVKNPPAMQEIWVQSLGLEDPSEKEMATHSSILACKIPRTGAWWATVHEAAKEVELT